MSDEEQERLVDELDQYIEQLRLQRPIQPLANLTPEMRPVYDMATRLRGVSPPIADPRPEFKEQLYRRLLTEIRAEDTEQLPFPSHAESAGVQEYQGSSYASDADSIGMGTEREQVSSPVTDLSQFRSIYRNNQVSRPAPAPSAPVPSAHVEPTNVKQRKRRGLSRRTLFTSGTIAATLVGAAVGAEIEHSLQSPATTPDQHPSITGKAWHLVAPLDQLGTEPIRFSADTITGYVIRQAGDSNEAVIAFSAACTHLGCIVQWQENTRQFPCPCHGRRFDDVGSPVYTENQPHYVPLPRLETKIENDNIYVKVPKM